MPFELVSSFKPTGDQPRAIDQLVSGINQNRKYQTLLGVTGSGKTFTLANVIDRVQKPTLVIANNKTLAAQLCAEFREFFPHNAVEYFVSYYDYYQPEAYIPQTDTYIDKEVQINEEIDRMRHSSTRSLLTRDDVIVVASVSCIYGLGMPEDYFNAIVKITTNKEDKRGPSLERIGFDLSADYIKTAISSRDDLIRQLVNIQYERDDFELKRGTFRVRGDIIDIYPVYQNELVRVAFWGDEVESIAEIEHITGQIKAKHETLFIYPAKHFIAAEDRMETALQNISLELDAQLKALESEGKMLEAHRLKQRTNYDLEMIREMGYCNGIENYSRHMDGRKPGEPPSVLINYFPKDYLLILDESHVTVPQVRGMYAGDRARKNTLIEHGFRLPSARDNRPLNFEEFDQRINQVIYMSATPGDYEIEHSRGQVVEQIIRPTGLIDPEIFVRKTDGQIDNLLDEINKRVANNERVLVTTLTKRMSEDLAEYLNKKAVKVRYLHSEIKALDRLEILHDLRAGVFDVLVGINLLREGLDLPEVSLVAILDADKEGFLRAERSLIQTIGRAARNTNGQVLFYADKITDSMRKAIDETNRRRIIQLAHNEKHGIKPQTIIKEIKDIRPSVKAEISALSKELSGFIHPDKLPGIIQKLEREMLDAAKNLEFEKAAVLRDEIEKLRNNTVNGIT
ncbi:MAG: excinuclease ABC subunit UvrB [Candidatus Margulisiibacteriota bacterium]